MFMVKMRCRFPVDAHRSRLMVLRLELRNVSRAMSEKCRWGEVRSPSFDKWMGLGNIGNRFDFGNTEDSEVGFPLLLTWPLEVI
jgi:hypothetical protein